MLRCSLARLLLATCVSAAYVQWQHCDGNTPNETGRIPETLLARLAYVSDTHDRFSLQVGRKIQDGECARVHDAGRRRPDDHGHVAEYGGSWPWLRFLLLSGRLSAAAERGFLAVRPSRAQELPPSQITKACSSVSDFIPHLTYIDTSYSPM
ncbi:hypothetical protein F4818DRAFT_422991 [Hypoxylon cercidicola]|nr:hypothetical protein F4818DRAFT_422991 [Hypoxylon cercidicola]